MAEGERGIQAGFLLVLQLFQAAEEFPSGGDDDLCVALEFIHVIRKDEYGKSHEEHLLVSSREIAEKVGISSPMVYKYLAEMKEDQGEKPKNSNNPKRTAVQEYKRIHPEAPAREIAEKVGIGKRMVYAYLSEMKKTET